MKKLKKSASSIMVSVFCCLFSCAVFYPDPAHCASATKGDQDSQVTGDLAQAVDPEALAILKKATDYLTGLPQFRLKGYKDEDALQESGQKLQFSSSFDVYLKRPNRLFVTRREDDGIIRRLWYDGKTASMYDEGQKVYGQLQVPDTIDTMLDYLETVMEFQLPLADLLYNDLSHLAERALTGGYLEISFIEDIACDHLAFRGKSVDWQIWVDRGEKPLIRKIVITYKELQGEPQLSARLEEWNTAPQFSDTLFQFRTPEGARRIPIVGSRREGGNEGGAQ
jgi:hypothetical protein